MIVLGFTKPEFMVEIEVRRGGRRSVIDVRNLYSFIELIFFRSRLHAFPDHT